MISEGRWPATSDEASGQSLLSRISADRKRSLRGIYLYPPPFRTLANGGTDQFYRKYGVMDQIQPELAVGIADFGIGADSPILLYYKKSKMEPVVINLDWDGDGNATTWVVMAESFSEFIDLLGL